MLFNTIASGNNMSDTDNIYNSKQITEIRGEEIVLPIMRLLQNKNVGPGGLVDFQPAQPALPP